MSKAGRNSSAKSKATNSRKSDDDLNYSLDDADKVPPGKTERGERADGDSQIQPESGGFDAIDQRIQSSIKSKATIPTTIRLSEKSDKALRKACSDFNNKSKADLVKTCIEEYLRARNYLDDSSLSSH